MRRKPQETLLTALVKPIKLSVKGAQGSLKLTIGRINRVRLSLGTTELELTKKVPAIRIQQERLDRYCFKQRKITYETHRPDFSEILSLQSSMLKQLIEEKREEIKKEMVKKFDAKQEE